MRELLDRFFNLTESEQREVLRAVVEWDWSDDIAGDLDVELKEYEQ